MRASRDERYLNLYAFTLGAESSEVGKILWHDLNDHIVSIRTYYLGGNERPMG
jgi:hypothetical protein